MDPDSCSCHTPTPALNRVTPWRLRKRFRSSNLLERSLEEVKRRTKVIGRFPGETSCLSMCWAVLDLFLAGARGLGLSDLKYKQVGPMKIARTQ